jgi:outer membrane protein assembly factor BamB
LLSEAFRLACLSARSGHGCRFGNGFTVSVIILVVCTTTHVLADNWPQWRGPQLNGTASETNLPIHWSKSEGTAWTLPLPAWSGSTPIIWGDRIFLNVADGPQVFLWCVDRDTGRVVWKRPIASGNRQIRKQNMSSPSPVTDGTHVWVMTGTGVLKAFDFAGNERWTRDLQHDYGVFGQLYGYGSSPLLFEDSLYLQVLHGSHTAEPSYLVRIDKTTGKTVWRVDRLTTARQESPDAYTTPALVRYSQRSEIVVSGADLVTGHDPATGAEIWRAEGLNPSGDGIYRIIASPFVIDGIVYAPSRERPMLAVKVGGRGDVSRSHVLWRFMNGPDVPTPVSDGTYVYVINDRGIMWCLDAKTGAAVYERQRLRPATYTGSPILADGKIYITSEDGVTSVVRAGPHFAVIAENELGEYTLSSPAVSDGQLFIRTDKFLYAIGERRRPRAPAQR